MFRAFSLLGLAFLTVAAVALSNSSSKNTPNDKENGETKKPREVPVTAVRARSRLPLYYAGFSLN
jgi:hypothetical protein